MWLTVQSYPLPRRRVLYSIGKGVIRRSGGGKDIFWLHLYMPPRAYGSPSTQAKKMRYLGISCCHEDPCPTISFTTFPLQTSLKLPLPSHDMFPLLAYQENHNLGSMAEQVQGHSWLVTVAPWTGLHDFLKSNLHDFIVLLHWQNACSSVANGSCTCPFKSMEF